MSNEWFARPVLFVADIDRSVDFYVKQLGFTQPWRYEEEGKAWVAQVDRQGCELILSSQWPDKVGKGLMFISLDVGVLDALRAFDLFYILTGGGREIQTMALYSYANMFQGTTLDFAPGVAAAVILFIICAIVGIVIVSATRLSQN